MKLSLVSLPQSRNRDRTTDVLRRMLDVFRGTFSYNAREAEGTQSPCKTLRSKSGTCRDYAWLMIEALRRVGFASRFVSGYLGRWRGGHVRLRRNPCAAAGVSTGRRLDTLRSDQSHQRRLSLDPGSNCPPSGPGRSSGRLLV